MLVAVVLAWLRVSCGCVVVSGDAATEGAVSLRAGLSAAPAAPGRLLRDHLEADQLKI